jgi:hypothetical protein
MDFSEMKAKAKEDLIRAWRELELYGVKITINDAEVSSADVAFK